MSDFLPYDWLVAIARSLVHTLWIFALSTGLAHACCSIVGSAAARYRIYLICLMSLPVTFIALVWWFLPVFTIGTPLVPDLPDTPSGEFLKGQPATWPVYLSMGYLLGLIAVGLRTVYHYFRGRKLRQSGLPPPPSSRQQFQTLREGLDRTINVSWYISRRVATVVAVGFLRPVILFPVGLLNQLTTQETEAILLHELAHLTRNDHRWVVLQQLVGDLFFYHPLVYWLGRQLDREREFACDDIVQQRVDREVYASALLQLARFTNSLHQSSIPQTVSATNSLPERLYRLFPSAKSSGRTWSYPYPSMALLVALFVLLSGTLSWAQSTPVPEAAQSYLQGRVLDATTLQPLIGAVVKEEDSNAGTVTDLEGNYSLRIPSGERTVAFIYTGYPSRTTTLTVTETVELDVLLDKNEKSAKTIQLSNDGDKQSIDINTKNLLYIIDGERYDGDPTDELDPADIESISVHKDAATIATFGYGSDFDGVIVITKKGSE